MPKSLRIHASVSIHVGLKLRCSPICRDNNDSGTHPPPAPDRRGRRRALVSSSVPGKRVAGWLAGHLRRPTTDIGAIRAFPKYCKISHQPSKETRHEIPALQRRPLRNHLRSQAGIRPQRHPHHLPLGTGPDLGAAQGSVL